MELNGRDLVKLAQVHPEIVEKFDLSALDARDWEELQEECPQFAEKCDKWEEMDFGRLLHFQPQLVRYCKLENLDGNGWQALLGQKPEYADRCDWSKLEGWHWAMLLEEQPQFAENATNGERSTAPIGHICWRNIPNGLKNAISPSSPLAILNF